MFIFIVPILHVSNSIIRNNYYYFTDINYILCTNNAFKITILYYVRCLIYFFFWVQAIIMFTIYYAVPNVVITFVYL